MPEFKETPPADPLKPARFHAFTLRAFNTFLRLSSLAAKLIFTLYIGRYFGLPEIGSYGLTTAYVAVGVTLIGMRFDYVASRDIVDVSPLEVAKKLRDQSAFFGLNYLVLIASCLLLLASPFGPLSASAVWITVFLAILESFAAITTNVFVSLKQPIFANLVFFIRAALWTFPVMALGILNPAYRTASTVFLFWGLGLALSLLITCFALKWLPWKQALQTPIDWQWIHTGLKKCVLIWIGSLGTTGAAYVDRFIVERYLGLEQVGIISFYGSFVSAIPALLHSGVFAFSSPLLISYHRRGDARLFKREIYKMALHSTLFAGCIGVAEGIAVPIIGTLFHRPEFTANANTLWLLLLAAWIQAATECLYYILYARHQDRVLVLTGLFQLVPVVICNIILVPILGLSGIGYGAILGAIFVGLWRFYGVFKHRAAS